MRDFLLIIVLSGVYAHLYLLADATEQTSS